MLTLDCILFDLDIQSFIALIDHTHHRARLKIRTNAQRCQDMQYIPHE